MDDLEDMMMMEAIRLSLASEEDRRRKEEKEARKKAKRQEKESKRAEKAARKNSLFTMNSNTSTADTSSIERSRSNLSLGQDDDPISGKGKGVERDETPPQEGAKLEDESQRPSYIPALSLSGTSQESVASSIPIPTASEPFRRSHLRQMSNASSASSSFVDSGQVATFSGTGTPPPGSLEPMFNFRSLAAMIGQDEKGETSAHVENADEPSPTSLEEDQDHSPLARDAGVPTLDDISPSRKVSEDDSALTKERHVVETSAAVSDV
jgi:hypothetical protein